MEWKIMSDIYKTHLAITGNYKVLDITSGQVKVRYRERRSKRTIDCSSVTWWSILSAQIEKFSWILVRFQSSLKVDLSCRVKSWPFISDQRWTFYVRSKVYFLCRIKCWPFISGQKLTYYFGSKVDLSSGQADIFYLFLLLFCAFHNYDFLAVALLELAMFLHWWHSSYDNKSVTGNA